MSPLTSILLTAGLALQASAATITVMVGAGGNFAFSPSEVKAAMGDVVEFQFPAGGNHSVVQGDFSNACQPAKTGGFFSGYMNTLSGPATNAFSVTINTTDAIAFYCSQQGPPAHCPAGMVGVINPSGSNTQANYASSAKNAQQVSAPASVFGGVIAPPSGGSSSTSSGAPAATTSPASGGGGGGIYGGGSGSSSGSGSSASGSGAGAIGASLSLMAAAVFAVYLA